MMTKAIPQNYTPEQTVELVAGYQAGKTVEQLAETLGKTVRSVVAKLSREGVYVAKTPNKGVARVKKAELVDLLAQRCGVAAEVFESLEKANHDVLEALVARLQ
jgi:molybdopterin converting factor small subunit